MKKYQLFTAAALAVTTLLASCTKDEEGATGQVFEDRVVKISISRDQVDSRGVGGQVTNGTELTVSSGYLLFTNSAKTVTMVVDVEAGEGQYDSAEQTIGITTITTGTAGEITNVPGQSSDVYFIGNAPSGMTTPAEGGKISDYIASVQSQYSSADGGVANVTVYGGGALVQDVGTPTKFNAEFDVKAIVGRFEIKKITGTASDASAFTYKVDGIYIDKYYSSMQVDGGAKLADLKDNGSTITNYGSGAGSYEAALAGSVFDYDAAGLATQAATSPAEGAWTYNLLAPTAYTDGTTDDIAMPAIIVSVSDVVVGGNAMPGRFFLTIMHFTLNSEPIEKLDGGKIYVISDLTFDQTDLTSEPFISEKSVTVDMNMVPWESAPIDWEL
jgi:hypothetical protein